MKKLLAIVISMAMLVAMMPMGVFADGGTSEEGSSGETPVTEKVAKIGDTEYETLAKAVAAATDGNTTITLLKSVTEDITVSANKNITIDLKGNSITNTSSDTITVAKGATLTVEGTGLVDNTTHAKAAIFNNGTVILNGGTYDRTSENGSTDANSGGNSFYTIINHGTMTINAGVTIQTAKKSNDLGRYSSLVENGYQNYTSTNERAGYVSGTNSEKPTLIINGGSFFGGLNTIKNDDGAELTINNGTFSNFYQAVVQNHNIATINNGNFTAAADGAETYGVDNCGCAAIYDVGTLTIKGGTFTAGKYAVYDRSAIEAAVKIENGTFSGGVEAIGVTSSSKANIAVTGGTFSDVSALRYLAKEGNLDVNININNANSKFEAAGISIPEANSSKRNITIDLNGSKWIGTNSLTGSTGTQNQVLQLLKGNNVTIKNGTISVKEGQTDPKASRFIIQNYSNLTLEDVTLDGTNLADNIAYTLSNNCGKVLLKGNTNIYAKDGQRAIDACWAPTHGYSEGTQVCINTTGEIRGTVEYDIWGENVGTDTLTTLEIKSGVFNGNFYIGEALKDVAKEKITITGGTFSSDPSAYVADGYVVTGNGPFTVGRPYTPSTPSTPATDNVTNNPADKNTTADLAPAVKDNKAETTVDAKTADKIVEKALENKSEEIIVDAAGNNTVASSEVGIPEKTVKEIAEKTDAKLVIKTDNGKVDLDKAAVKALADQAGTTGTVKLIVETVKTDADICHVNLKLVTSNGAVTDFKGGNVAVTINLDKELAAKDVVCVYINDNGIYTLVNGQKNADGTYTFTTGHFSEYAVMAKDEADKKTAEQLDTMIKDVNLKVRTSKTSKKNIKAVVSGDVKAITDAGYTVKYKFYRSEKKASKYVGKVTKDTKTYINTAGKKGTKYYYKAKALVYDGDKLVGQTVLKQCKYGARTWSK